jgi:hypothetical protein
MRPITAVLPYSPLACFEPLAGSVLQLPQVQKVVIVGKEAAGRDRRASIGGVPGRITEERTLSRIIDGIETEYMLLILPNGGFSVDPSGIERLLARAESEGVGAVYADFLVIDGDERRVHPVNDYQSGSVRDDFDFGPMMLFSVSAVKECRKRRRVVSGTSFAGLYDLRLKLSIDHGLIHLEAPLCSMRTEGGLSDDARLFAYVDRRNLEVQKEMETVFTDYLREIDAYVSPSRLKDYDEDSAPFPVEASVVIPVKNREGTIGDAVKSALSQVAGSSFNVIVVDNHSTDGTTGVLRDLAFKNPRLVHIIPERRDLLIGGCWNEALESRACGRHAIQLDSDDLYRDEDVVQKILDMFKEGHYGMVVGSYTLVNSRLEEIPPGLVDHREWTSENGHNNALRVNGLGAPRAFRTSLMRAVRFPNVSYGEDYAAALSVCGEYRVGRIYESLYLCRRWSGNSDARLSVEESNRNNAYKDLVRSQEIAKRRKRLLEDGC